MTTQPLEWKATAFFARLVVQNQLAQAHGFRFCRVSGLDGFEETLHTLRDTKAFLCLSDTAQGYTELDPTPHTRRVKTLLMAVRHPLDDMPRRAEALDLMRELFRQMMSVLLQERVRIEQQHIYLDPRITFHEIDRYFLAGCACAYFQVAVDVYTDLRYNPDEWKQNTP